MKQSLLTKYHNIIAIESSCDDSSVCQFINGEFNEITISSLKKHAITNGIVPEIASREHEIAFPYCLEVLKTNKSPEFIAYTSHPGLPGSLHIGSVVAQTLSSIFKVPIIEINHIYGHIFASFIENDVKLPALALIVSGGHSAIYFIDKNYSIKQLIASPDDAVGEILDKVGRELKLPYPGGVFIDKIYDDSKSNLVFAQNHTFSFSGIKTAVFRYMANYKEKKDQDFIVSVGSSLNKLLVKILIKNLKHFIDIYHPVSLIIGGGVASNNLLRKEIKNFNINTYIPSKKYCQDNASMIAAAAIILKQNNKL